MAGKRGGALPGPPWVRFWAKVDRHGPDECWVWVGALNDSGYGVIYDGTRLVYAHRMSWWLHGGTIPEGHTVDHLCFNRACVNPRHLEPVEHIVNVRRAWAHGPWSAIPPSASGRKRTPETIARMSAAQRARRAREREDVA